jgi:hypothetical protein
MMHDTIEIRQNDFSNLIALKFSPEELNNKFSHIQQIITLIGENDNYARLLASFGDDDGSISNAKEIRADFVKQLIEQLADFDIYLQAAHSENIHERTRILPVSQAA